MSSTDLKKLKKIRSSLQKRIELLDSLIDEYNNTDPELYFDHYLKFESKIIEGEQPIIFEKDDFPKEKTWLTQLTHLLNKHERFLGNTEMAELLLPYYPDKNVDALKRRVSVVISDAYKNNKVRGLVKLKVNDLPQKFVWGYKKWLDSNMEILQKYKPIRHHKSPLLWG